jgi:hypothetical protein
MDFGFEGGCDHQPFQNIIITTLNHEHFPHGTSTFNRNNVLDRSVIFTKNVKTNEVRGATNLMSIG